MKKLIILFIPFFLLSFGNLKAQNNKIDSLLDIVATSEKDSVLMFACSDLSDIYIANKPDSSIYWAHLALIKAEKINYPKGILYMHNNLGEAYGRKGLFDSSYRYFKKVQLLAQNFDNSDYAIKALINLGITNAMKGDYLNAEESYKTALKKAAQKNDTNNIITCQSKLALLYKRTGRTKKAIDMYFIVLDAYEKANIISGQANVLVNLGSLFSEQKDFDKAIEYYNKALPLYKSINNKYGINIIYENKASSYSESEQLDSSEHYSIKAIELSKERGSLSSLASSLSRYSVLLRQKGKYLQAIEIGKESLELKRKLGMKASMTYNFSSLSDVYRKIGDYRTSNIYTDSVYQYAKQFGDTRNLAYAYESYSKNNEALGNYMKALDYYKLYKTMNDSLFEESKTKTINELEISYETEKKEQQNSLLTTENSLQKAKINSKNTLIYSLIIIFILAVGIALVWYIAHNRAVKQKHRIQLGQQKIEAQEQIIREVSSML
ncbi:MAG: tetratricopeptide repeat protein, partial [Bacteroidota bacterium]|nr:tetratricopeptide repeat protein [Bacteroidota bacterium]